MKISKHFLSIAAFIAVCCMGWFCAADGGVRWGTEGAGMTSFMTFVCAIWISAGVLFIADDST